MIQLHEQYIIDERGTKTAIVIPVTEWNQIQEDLEELDEIRAYDNAKSKGSDPILFDDAVKEIRKDRKR